MHYHCILLVQADSLEEAKEKVEDFCNTDGGEHSYFDFGSIVPDKETEFNKPLSLVKDKLPVDDHITVAKTLIEEADKMLGKQQYGAAGYNFCTAGSLLQEQFCTESKVFNIQYYDYSREYGEGWYAIEVDFHY